MHLFRRLKTFMYEKFSAHTLVKTTNGNRLSVTAPFSHLKPKRNQETDRNQIGLVH